MMRKYDEMMRGDSPLLISDGYHCSGFAGAAVTRLQLKQHSALCVCTGRQAKAIPGKSRSISPPVPPTVCQGS